MEFIVLNRGRAHAFPRFRHQCCYVHREKRWKPDIVVSSLLSTSFINQLVDQSIRTMVCINLPLSFYIHPRFLHLLEKIRIGGSVYIVSETELNRTTQWKYDSSLPTIDKQELYWPDLVHLETRDWVFSAYKIWKLKLKRRIQFRFLTKPRWGRMHGIRMRIYENV